MEPPSFHFFFTMITTTLRRISPKKHHGQHKLRSCGSSGDFSSSACQRLLGWARGEQDGFTDPKLEILKDFSQQRILDGHKKTDHLKTENSVCFVSYSNEGFSKISEDTCLHLESESLGDCNFFIPPLGRAVESHPKAAGSRVLRIPRW